MKDKEIKITFSQLFNLILLFLYALIPVIILSELLPRLTNPFEMGIISLMTIYILYYLYLNWYRE